MKFLTSSYYVLGALLAVLGYHVFFTWGHFLGQILLGVTR